jgi:uncharacterized protein (DUF488 family)
MATHLFTIGFTQKTAEQFFGLLRDHAVTTLVDIRLHPDSQLSGFAKARDLPYFLRHLCGADYLSMPAMTPDEALLKTYRADKDWTGYEARFNQLLESRALIGQLDRAWWAGGRACLLCSEHKPDQCHRRLVAEYLRAHWPEVEIVHLM